LGNVRFSAGYEDEADIGRSLAIAIYEYTPKYEDAK
jgi:hypothetical protein